MTTQSITADADELERFSRIADQWWDENGKFRPLHRINPLRIGYIRDRICAHYGKDPQARAMLSGLSLLDIGCGGGLLCEPMRRLGASVTGIDAAEKNIRVAALHAERMGLAIDYRCATPETLPEKAAFDAVLALEIVEHVADVPAFLNACTGLLKPGGILLMSTLNRTVKSWAMAIAGAEYVLRWLPRGTHSWKKFITPAELCGGLRREGLQIDHMTGMAFNPFKNTWHLAEKDMDVNYLLTATKAA